MNLNCRIFVTRSVFGNTLVFDGIITQRLVDLAESAKLTTIVGMKISHITKLPTSIKLWTKKDFE